MSRKILLIDGFSILNRAFYALPLLTTKEGEYTNAVYGFMNIFFRFCDEEKPDYITVAFDLPQPTFRHEKYGAYKGTRKSMPEELRGQVPILKDLLAKMQIGIAECPGFEADDVIGTLAVKAEAEGITPVIISGDRDLLQLATDKIKIRLPKTKAGKTEVEDYNAADVLEKYGVSPQAYIDVKALMGDASDNVPGVPGIGEVTATKIITAYGSLDNAMENARDIKPKKAAENLVEFKEQAMLSKMLVTIVTDAPVELSLDAPDKMWNAEALAEVRRLELKTLYKRFDGNEKTEETKPISFDIIKQPKDAKTFFETLHEKFSALYLLWDAYEKPQLAGMAIATESEAVKYIPADSGELSLASVPGMTGAELLELAKPWLESDSPKCMFDTKNEARHLFTHGIVLSQNNNKDIMLGAYILDPLAANNTPSDIAEAYLQKNLPTLEDILDNKGKRTKDRRTVSSLSEERLAEYASGIADVLFRAWQIVEAKLITNNQLELYEKMELPISKILFGMEVEGIKVDSNILTEYGSNLDGRLSQLTATIYDLAGEEFNINSPAQVGTILFEKLELKGGKRTKQGYSTAADVLEKLVDKHPIVPLILEYRAHSKLKSTYVDGLLPLINSETSRVHSTFNQALTATGRLSSAEPNLQNIPVRMPLGRALRKAFIPKEGTVFVDADYSQIELRLLAHMSEDEILIKAFNENMDIHRLTASQVLGIPQADVTAEERNRAKAVNFGIIYGISAFGLSEDLKISPKEAETYISGYFRQYPGVKGYLDRTVQDAKDNGYVSTIYNRRRFMPELKSHNFNLRSFGERVAMNMPIQGSAADIIKIAMINVVNRLQKEGLTSKLILQVHDELLLEVLHSEIDQVTHILKEEMENAVKLKVPLVADVSVGESWYGAK